MKKRTLTRSFFLSLIIFFLSLIIVVCVPFVLTGCIYGASGNSKATLQVSLDNGQTKWFKVWICQNYTPNIELRWETDCDGDISISPGLGQIGSPTGTKTIDPPAQTQEYKLDASCTLFDEGTKKATVYVVTNGMAQNMPVYWNKDQGWYFDINPAQIGTDAVQVTHISIGNPAGVTWHLTKTNWLGVVEYNGDFEKDVNFAFAGKYYITFTNNGPPQTYYATDYPLQVNLQLGCK
ncbi:MAG TPA: hypothetical protein PLP23_14680 [Panacibacter sp.]|nr:hypothetical protein [Panacibacter sp.]